ncbi:MAG: DUF397 domain-containing protein [Actinobacteria bacterium]|nr:DUF397 domain-containing protein [Actinomycetota bacterium]MBI3687309.1 DUF397 domain-containing protein [Actinomycetota bacterium]
MNDQPGSALSWKKSTASATSNCVEVADTGDLVYVRDSKAAGTGPLLTFSRAEWDAFVAGVYAGEFSLESPLV